MDTTIKDITFSDIHLIENLWEKNRIYHEKTSEHFSSAYQGLCFRDRMEKFENMDANTYIISVYIENDIIQGYCISTAKEACGEIESIHVDEKQRGKGIGEKLAGYHLKWMKNKGCKNIGVTVSQENEATIGFYKKLGFYPNTIYMELK